MTLENTGKLARKPAEIKRCGFVSVKIKGLETTILQAVAGKIIPISFNSLAGQWKTNRATNPRQRTAALTATIIGGSHG